MLGINLCTFGAYNPIEIAIRTIGDNCLLEKGLYLVRRNFLALYIALIHNFPENTNAYFRDNYVLLRYKHIVVQKTHRVICIKSKEIFLLFVKRTKKLSSNNDGPFTKKTNYY